MNIYLNVVLIDICLYFRLASQYHSMQLYDVFMGWGQK